jgi:hypothetical protein
MFGFVAGDWACARDVPDARAAAAVVARMSRRVSEDGAGMHSRIVGRGASHLTESRIRTCDAAEVLKDALEVPAEARAALVGPLVDSLDAEVDEGVEEAWREEIRQRLEEVDSELRSWFRGMSASASFGLAGSVDLR